LSEKQLKLDIKNIKPIKFYSNKVSDLQRMTAFSIYSAGEKEQSR